MNITGNWKCDINHSLYTGQGTAEVKEGNPYRITLNIDSPYFPKVHFVKIEEKGNELDVTARIEMIPLNIKTHVVFNGDKFNGIVKIPFIGDILL